MTTRVRVRLDFTIDTSEGYIPTGLDRIADFIEGGLERVGVVGDGKAVDLLPGARVNLAIVGGARKPARRGVR